MSVLHTLGICVLLKFAAPSPLANGEVKNEIKELNTAPSPLANGEVKSGILEVFILKYRNLDTAPSP